MSNKSKRMREDVKIGTGARVTTLFSYCWSEYNCLMVVCSVVWFLNPHTSTKMREKKNKTTEMSTLRLTCGIPRPNTEMEMKETRRNKRIEKHLYRSIWCSLYIETMNNEFFGREKKGKKPLLQWHEEKKTPTQYLHVWSGHMKCIAARNTMHDRW